MAITSFDLAAPLVDWSLGYVSALSQFKTARRDCAYLRSAWTSLAAFPLVTGLRALAPLSFKPFTVQ